MKIFMCKKKFLMNLNRKTNLLKKKTEKLHKMLRMKKKDKTRQAAELTEIRGKA